MDNREKLKSLLTVAYREEYDDDAVRALLNRDPAAARGCDYQPLHRALEFRASATTVGLLCDACPELIRETTSLGCTVLHTACQLRATLEVVRLLHERWPAAIAAKDEDGCAPLHDACCNQRDGYYGPSLEVVKYLVDKRSEALAEKTPDGETPLSLACGNEKPSAEVVKFLIENNADAVKDKDNDGWFPLHVACAHNGLSLEVVCDSGLSLEVVAMLVDIYPNALESKSEDYGDTPLHLACSRVSGESLEAVKLLIERFPQALKMQNLNNQTPLERAKQQRDPSPEIIDLLITLHSLTNLAENDPEIITILRSFHDMDWPGGVALVLDAFPSVVNTIDHSLFPTILSLVGRRCSLSTFYAMLQDNPTLVKGVVKTKKDKQRSEEPPAKRIRK